MRKKILFVFPQQTDSVFPLVVIFFFCTLHLALLNDFLPPPLWRTAAAVAAVLIAWKLDFAPV